MKAASNHYRVVAFAPNRWQGPWMNRQQLLSRLGRAIPVVYSNGAWFTWQRNDPAWERARMLGRFERSDDVWLDQPPRLLLRSGRFRRWDRAMLAIQGRRLRAFSGTHGEGPLIGYSFHPGFDSEVDALRPDIRVYHAYDLFESTPGWSDELAAREHRLLAGADLVVASSEVIAASLRSRGADEVLVLPNGADSALFAAAAEAGREPPDLLPIPRPRIGYVGNLNRKVDFGLVERLARAHEAWHFVFVGALGNLDDKTRVSYQECLTLRNVHFLGGKAHSELPAYVSAMDVNIMAYRIDSAVWTEGIYPLKLHEYLAAGRPVVSSDVPSVREFAHVVALAQDPEEWTDHLGKAIDGVGVGTVETRRRTAQENDWDARVQILARYLERLAGAAGATPAP